MTRHIPAQSGTDVKAACPRIVMTNVANILGKITFKNLFMINSFLILPSVYQRIVNFWLGKVYDRENSYSKSAK
jgi:hypothetical protein